MKRKFSEFRNSDKWFNDLNNLKITSVISVSMFFVTEFSELGENIQWKLNWRCNYLFSGEMITFEHLIKVKRC